MRLPVLVVAPSPLIRGEDWGEGYGKLFHPHPRPVHLPQGRGNYYEEQLVRIMINCQDYPDNALHPAPPDNRILLKLLPGDKHDRLRRRRQTHREYS